MLDLFWCFGSLVSFADRTTDWICEQSQCTGTWAGLPCTLEKLELVIVLIDGIALAKRLMSRSITDADAGSRVQI